MAVVELGQVEIKHTISVPKGGNYILPVAFAAYVLARFELMRRK